MIDTPKSYKGIPIIKKQGGGRLNARYIPRIKTIYLYDNWFTYNKVKRTQILQHEFSHPIWVKIPFLYRKIWGLISSGKLNKILYVFGITNYLENAYISKYAEKNISEDFSETVSIGEISIKKDIKYNNFVDTKIKLALSLYNYFDE